MKFVSIVLILSYILLNSAFGQSANSYTTQLAKLFSKDLLESNGVLYMEPVVRIVNATSNSRFFNSAYIPTNVESPYFRVGIQTMTGFVSDDLKSYNPSMPAESFSPDQVGKYIDYNILTNKITRLDTAGLIRYIFLNMMYDGIYGKHKGAISIPTNASTALGTGNTKFLLPTDTLRMLFKDHPLYNLSYIPQELKDSVEGYLGQFPQEFTLYGGNNLSTIAAGIPQVEIGSLYGTELLLRVVPPVKLSETIGEFAFWGIGLKHSLSQYLYSHSNSNLSFEELKTKEPHDLALQVVYQGTSLKNKIGVTQADMNALATIFNFNLNYSFFISKYLNVFAGVAYQTISIDTKYVYKLPIEIQWQLGLLEPGKHDPTPGYPGDNAPQTTELVIEDNSAKATFGITGTLGNIDFILDYNMSKFDILGFGVQYRF
ncbi:MAG TPA: hypothetical protein PLE30_07900 [Candidatus Kapabacteria bacterium]|nr:hypothetical protein [Candidatus Kapabacteria bacterium]